MAQAWKKVFDWKKIDLRFTIQWRNSYPAILFGKLEAIICLQI